MRVQIGFYTSVSVDPRAPDLVRRIVGSRAEVCNDDSSKTLPVSVPYMISLLPEQTHNGNVELPQFLKGSSAFVDAIETLMAQALVLGDNVELELALGAVRPTRFQQGVSDSVMALWQKATVPFLRERIGSWKFDRADVVQDFFFEVCSECYGRECTHNAKTINLRQRTSSEGTEIVHKQTLEKVDGQVVTWADAASVAEVVRPTLLAFPAWVNKNDVFAYLGPLALNVAPSGIEVHSATASIKKLRGFSLPRPHGSGVPDCRLRLSVEKPVVLQQLLVPLKFVRKSQRESISCGPWKLVMYTVYSGATEREVNNNMANNVLTHNIELELDVQKYMNERKAYGDLIYKAGAVSMLSKLYNVFGDKMCASKASILPCL